MNSTKGTSDEIDKIFSVLEMLINGSNAVKYIMGDEPKMKQRYDALREAKTAITNLIAQEVNKARLEEVKMCQKVLRGGKLPVVASIFNNRIAQLTNREDI